MPEYALILLFFFAFSFILHQKFKVQIFKSKRQFMYLYSILFVAAVAWDNFAIYRGHWSFGENFLLGPRIWYMPIEEYAFVIITSYFGLVLYKISEKYFK